MSHKVRVSIVIDDPKLHNHVVESIDVDVPCYFPQDPLEELTEYDLMRELWTRFGKGFRNG